MSKPNVTATTNELESSRIGIRQFIIVALITRTVTDTSVQMFYTFAPIMAVGLGLSAVQFGQLITLRSVMGLTAPFFGEWAERSGYRIVMVVGLVLATLGLLVFGFGNGLIFAIVGAILLGIGVSVFTPTLQAYASDRLPDEARARGMSIIEYAYAFAAILGLFLVGQLIELVNWRAPFIALGVVVLLASLFFGRSIDQSSAPQHNTDLRNLLVIRHNARGAWGMIVATALCAFSALHTIVAHGTWLFTEYELNSAELGVVALLMGIFALGGSVLVSVILDRIGRKRGLIVGGFVTAGAFASLFILNQNSFYLAVAGLLIANFMFEFTIVSALIVTSEQAPAQRAKVTTISAAIGTLGVGLAGLTSPVAFETFGVIGLSIPSALGFVAVALIVAFALRD